MNTIFTQYPKYFDASKQSMLKFHRREKWPFPPQNFQTQKVQHKSLTE